MNAMTDNDDFGPTLPKGSHAEAVEEARLAAQRKVEKQKKRVPPEKIPHADAED